MSDQLEKNKIEKAAEELFKNSNLSGQPIKISGSLAEPIPIKDFTGEIHSWFVPVVSGSKLCGFLQIFPNLELHRYSSFQRSPDSVAACPEAIDWLDRETILSRAQRFAKADETLQEPFLTYDISPEKIVWSVTAVSPLGAIRNILVAGEFVYEQVFPGRPATGGK